MRTQTSSVTRKQTIILEARCKALHPGTSPHPKNRLQEPTSGSETGNRNRARPIQEKHRCSIPSIIDIDQNAGQRIRQVGYASCQPGESLQVKPQAEDQPGRQRPTPSPATRKRYLGQNENGTFEMDSSFTPQLPGINQD